jgi:hypothetical protein
VTDGINPSVPPSGAGCVECEAGGTWWLHLRRCAECGHVGCCDDSLLKHATAHFHETGHPIMQTFEPGESWFWNYVTGEGFEGPVLADPDSHPSDQTTPGPQSRVPRDWQTQLADQR